jgi:Rrf2 family protein
MDLSKTARYALRLMSYMASSGEDQFTSEELHEKLKIPRQYLRRLMTGLSKKGLLTSNKGRSGGFSLARRCDTIYLSEIIDASDGSTVLPSCILGFDKCLLLQKCPLHDQWMEVRVKILEILRTTTLTDMNIRLIEHISH